MESLSDTVQVFEPKLIDLPETTKANREAMAKLGKTLLKLLSPIRKVSADTCDAHGRRYLTVTYHEATPMETDELEATWLVRERLAKPLAEGTYTETAGRLVYHMSLSGDRDIDGNPFVLIGWNLKDPEPQTTGENNNE